jgi:hypothetical protein
VVIPIRLILQGGIPTEVFEAIVSGIAVAMAGLHTFGTGAYKGFQHYTVDIDPLTSTTLGQQDVLIASRVEARLKDSFVEEAVDFPLIRHLIPVGVIAWDGLKTHGDWHNSVELV